MNTVEPSGPELAQMVRALLPPGRRESFDGMADLYTPDEAEISQCGALLSLTGPFRECIEAKEIDEVRAILKLADELLTYPEGRDTHGSLRNSVLSCFLENVLPLPEELRSIVPLEPNTRAFAEEHDPYWLGSTEPDWWKARTPTKPSRWRRVVSSVVRRFT